MEKPNVGILIAQLGTPDAPTPRALKPYLREFLGDRRVIETNRLAWWFILNFLVLPRRPRTSAALYRKVWTERGSPLLFYTEDQTRALQAALGETIKVEFGMRYGNPQASVALEKFRQAGVERLLIFPMFPQYSGATTGSVHDAVFEHYGQQRLIPALRFVPPYYKHPAYIEALATVARESIAAMPWKPEKILISFHGIPKRYIENGDVYQHHAEETTRALTAALELGPADYELCYQSRFGKEEWLQPYTSDKLTELARSGVKRIAAICPGFTTDCLETIDEIGREAKEEFQEAGGEDLRLIPCPNAHPAWIEAMATIAREELAGWTE